MAANTAVKEDWTFATNLVLTDVMEERHRQNEKWGEQNHQCINGIPTVILSFTGPSGQERRVNDRYLVPYSKDAKKLVDDLHDRGQLTFADILIEELSEAVEEFDIEKRREELIQVAAVAVAWVEKIDRELIDRDKTRFTTSENF